MTVYVTFRQFAAVPFRVGWRYLWLLAYSRVEKKRVFDARFVEFLGFLALNILIFRRLKNSPLNYKNVNINNLSLNK